MIIEVNHVSKRFKGKHGSGEVVALEDVSLQVAAGETVGIVGGSGSGKSTLARIMLGLIPADEGSVRILDREVVGATLKSLRPLRADLQIVLQNPHDALNPRWTVGRAIAEPLKLHTDLDGPAREARVAELLTSVQLGPHLAGRFPHQLSGGQQQRVTIARAIATNPKVVIFDEPTSGLDVSVRAELLRLLARVQSEMGLTYVLISHDLPTIRGVCDHVVVMYLGRVIEAGPTAELFANPRHPYTRHLIGAELPIDPTVPLPPLVAFDPRALAAEEMEVAPR